MNPTALDSTAGSTWIVIPVHNRCAITGRCLHHLETLGVRHWARVVVVEDGSSDGTREMIVSEFPWVKVIAGDGHLWWTGAIRLGMEKAIQNGAECVCWLNDDCLPDPGALETVVGIARKRQAVCGGVCRGPDGVALAYGGGLMECAWPVPLRQLPDSHDEVCHVDWLHGNMVAMTSSTWSRIGLPESRWMPQNLADIAYTYAAHQHSIPVCLAPSSTAWAEPNHGPSYQSWADPNLGCMQIIQGLWNPRVWWYAPGLAYFLIRLFGARGFARLLGLTAKLLAVLLMKVLMPDAWLIGLRRLKAKNR